MSALPFPWWVEPAVRAIEGGAFDEAALDYWNGPLDRDLREVARGFFAGVGALVGVDLAASFDAWWDARVDGELRDAGMESVWLALSRRDDELFANGCYR